MSNFSCCGKRRHDKVYELVYSFLVRQQLIVITVLVIIVGGAIYYFNKQILSSNLATPVEMNSLSATPVHGTAPLMVEFSARGTFAKTYIDGGDLEKMNPPSFSISLGDGEYVLMKRQGCAVTTCDLVATHTYEAPGVYVANLLGVDGGYDLKSESGEFTCTETELGCGSLSKVVVTVNDSVSGVPPPFAFLGFSNQNTIETPYDRPTLYGIAGGVGEVDVTIIHQGKVILSTVGRNGGVPVKDGRWWLPYEEFSYDEIEKSLANGTYQVQITWNGGRELLSTGTLIVGASENLP